VDSNTLDAVSGEAAGLRWPDRDALVFSEVWPPTSQFSAAGYAGMGQLL